MSGCAFSISSSSTTEYGCLRTFSLSWPPPSSKPTYPGGAPIKRLTLCFSMYSLMSIRTSESSLPKSSLQSTFASSVLPTPVGPRNKKLPIGRLLLRMPARLRRMDFTIASTAWSWPITRCLISSPRWMSF